MTNVNKRTRTDEKDSTPTGYGTAKDIAAFLGISEFGVYHAIRVGRMKAKKLGKRILIRYEDAEAALEDVAAVPRINPKALKVGAALLAFLIFAPAARAETRIGAASWYSVECCKFNPDPKCPTASGRSLYELEDSGVWFAAMWDVPMHSLWKVTNVETGRSVVVQVEDRGPARRLNRVIDLSKAAFEQIADTNKGVVRVAVERVK